VSHWPFGSWPSAACGSEGLARVGRTTHRVFAGCVVARLRDPRIGVVGRIRVAIGLVERVVVLRSLPGPAVQLIGHVSCSRMTRAARLVA
jgi:hypothetical protein